MRCVVVILPIFRGRTLRCQADWWCTHHRSIGRQRDTLGWVAALPTGTDPPQEPMYQGQRIIFRLWMATSLRRPLSRQQRTVCRLRVRHSSVTTGVCRRSIIAYLPSGVRWCCKRFGEHRRAPCWKRESRSRWTRTARTTTQLDCIRDGIQVSVERVILGRSGTALRSTLQW
jgi:hypothetical protein